LGWGNNGEGATKTGPSYTEIRVAEGRVIEVLLYVKSFHISNLIIIFCLETVKTPQLLRKVGLETSFATVLLTATSDGQLLPPAVVLKGERALQTFQANGVSIPVLSNADGVVSASVLLNWCQLIWFRYSIFIRPVISNGSRLG